MEVKLETDRQKRNVAHMACPYLEVLSGSEVHYSPTNILGCIINESAEIGTTLAYCVAAEGYSDLVPPCPQFPNRRINFEVLAPKEVADVCPARLLADRHSKLVKVLERHFGEELAKKDKPPNSH